MKSAWFGLAALVLLHGASAGAQQQAQPSGTSIADAARRARDLKKEQPKSTKVWDNDTIPKKPGEISVVGERPVATTDDAAAAGDDGGGNQGQANQPAEATPKAEESKAAGEIASIQSDLAAAKSHLQTVKTDLDILQQTLTLDSQMYYSKPNYAADKDGGAKIDGEKAAVEAKQQEMADAQKKVDELELKLAAVR